MTVVPQDIVADVLFSVIEAVANFVIHLECHLAW